MPDKLVPAWNLDPERIAERVFGGPHFIRGWEDMAGEWFCTRDKAKWWRKRDIVRAWHEGTNCPPVARNENAPAD